MQFWSSLVGRRFPRLQQLKSSRITELIVAQRRQAGHVLPTRNPSYPKSRRQNVAQLVYFGHGSGAQDVVGAELPRKQVGLKTVSVPLEGARPIQRENPDWQWCGHAFVGQHNWRPSGKHCSRFDAARHGKQVRISDDFKCALCSNVLCNTATNRTLPAALHPRHGPPFGVRTSTRLLLRLGTRIKATVARRRLVPSQPAPCQGSFDSESNSDFTRPASPGAGGTGSEATRKNQPSCV